MHPAALETDDLLSQCDVRRQRRGGPGGQHRNKVETAIVLLHRPTGVIASASERRSQEQNRQVAIGRLRLGLALNARSQIDESYVASSRWQERCVAGRIHVSAGHQDFPILLAEALDVVFSQKGDLGSAAAILGCTASQLTKLLKKEPAALESVNDLRRSLGLSRLR